MFNLLPHSCSSLFKCITVVSVGGFPEFCSKTHKEINWYITRKLWQGAVSKLGLKITFSLTFSTDGYLYAHLTRFKLASTSTWVVTSNIYITL